MWSMWLSVVVVTLSLVAAQHKCGWTHDCPTTSDHASFASATNAKPHFKESSPRPRTSSPDKGNYTTVHPEVSGLVLDGREETVESTIFPGMMVPPEVEEALGTLLSKETVEWLDQQEAEGKEVVNLEGQVIPHDMKDLIRTFVQRNDPEYKANKRTPIMETVQVRDGGTKPGSPYVDKHRPLELDCPPRRPSVSSIQLSEKWTKLIVEMILKREVVMGGLVTLLAALIVAAVLFVYGVSDVWAAVLHALTAIQQQLKGETVHREVHSSEDKTSSKSHAKSNGRSKSKETTSKSGSKKRSKSISSRSRTEATEVKREVSHGKPIKGKTVGEPSEDENNDWQEVMHNKPKCRSRSKQYQEEDSYPVASKTVSQPTTPKTPPQSTASPVPAPKCEETMVSHVKPINTNNASIKRESWTGDEVNVGLQLTMTSSGAFSDEKTPSSGFDLSALANETYILQSPIQQSPFAASTDIPFFTSSPIRGGYPSAHTPTEQQFQSKVDCLLRNLRNKPFTMHPVSSTSHLRRTPTDLDDRMFVPRMGMSMQSSFSGPLDPMLSSSGMLNNRLMYSEEGHLMRQFSAGLPPVRSSRMRQRAGSLPLTQSQSPSPYSPGQGRSTNLIQCQFSMLLGGTHAVQVHGLANSCSLFSSNPSIWSVDWDVDRNLVTSSMTNSSSLRQAPSNESFDFKRCLPDQLLSEMGSPDPYA